MIVIVAAVAKNGVLGKENAIPWRLPEDIAHFKTLTTGHTVVMGRKTWESLPARFRPLPGRRNIVVTRKPDYQAPGADIAHSLAEAIELGADDTALFIIGGAELYAQALPLAQRLELTEIDAEIDGDAYFPTFDRRQWRETARVPGRSASGLGYAFVTYERVGP